MKPHKVLEKLLSGSKNVRFGDMLRLVEAFGFTLARVSGSHHIFIHPDIGELVNLQDVSGQVKPYQAQQFLKLIEKHNLKIKDRSKA